MSDILLNFILNGSFHLKSHSPKKLALIISILFSAVIFFNAFNITNYSELRPKKQIKDGGFRGSWANEIKAYGSNIDKNNYDHINQLKWAYKNNYLESINRTLEQRNHFSITKTSKALIELNQNLYGFFKAVEPNSSYKNTIKEGEGVFGTKYDCKNDREGVGNQYCEFIEFLEYTKNEDLKVILVLSGHNKAPDRWLRPEDFQSEDFDIKNWRATQEQWNNSILSVVRDLNYLKGHYPNLAGFSIDDFGAKLCSIQNAETEDTYGPTCLKREDLMNIYHDLNPGINFYPLIYDSRSNHLIQDAIFISKPDFGPKLYNNELIKVKIPIQNNKVLESGNCIPKIKGLTSDSHPSNSDSDDNILPFGDDTSYLKKRIYFEYSDSTKDVLFQSDFNDQLSNNDQLDSIVNFRNQALNLSKKFKLVIEIIYMNPQIYDHNFDDVPAHINKGFYWTISNLDIECKNLKTNKIHHLIPKVEKAMGYIVNLNGEEYQMGNTSIINRHKKIYAGYTKKYNLLGTNNMIQSVNIFDFASVIKGYQLAMTNLSYDKDLTKTWSNAAEYENYFRNFYKVYQEKSNDFIFMMYGIDQLGRGDHSLKTVSTDVIKEYGGNFWYYKGGLELYYLNNDSGIGYMSYTEHDSIPLAQDYSNTLFIPSSSTKYPYYYACFAHKFWEGDKIHLYETNKDHPHLKTDIFSSLRHIKKININWNGEKATISPTPDEISNGEMIHICITDQLEADGEKIENANRANTKKVYIKIIDADGNEVALNKEDFEAGFFDLYLSNDNPKIFNDLWRSITESFQ